MLIIRGVNLFPTQVEELIVKEAALAPHYQLEVTRPGALDEITVHVERAAQAGEADGRAAGQRLATLIKSLIGISAGVDVMAPGGIERSLGKARRVVDRRPKA
jgi:phenylacetate-CoA ligase